MKKVQVKDQLAKAQQGAKVSIIMYVLLTTLKLLFGYMNGSHALVADGLNNATDVVSSVALLIGLAISMKPADDNHNYGHYRSEYIGSLIAAFIMFAVSVQVILQGIRHYINQDFSTPSIETAVVAILSALAMLLVYFYNRNLAKKVDSSALKAAAADNLSDALVSLGTFVGIVGVFMGLPFLDTVAAIVVGLLIMKTAIEIFFETAITLTDGFDAETLDEMKKIVLSVEDVLSVVDIKGRNHGVMTFIDVTVTVDANLTVAESHDITENIEHNIKEAYGAIETIVHLEPHE